MVVLDRRLEIEQVGRSIASITRPAPHKSQASLLQDRCPTINNISREIFEIFFVFGKLELPADDVIQDVKLILGELFELCRLMTGMLNLFDDGPLLFRCSFVECTESEVDTRSNLLLCVFVAHIGVRCPLND